MGVMLAIGSKIWNWATKPNDDDVSIWFVGRRGWQKSKIETPNPKLKLLQRTASAAIMASSKAVTALP